MRDKTFVETPLYAVPTQGNDPMARSLWEDVKSLTKGDMPCLRYRGKVIWAPNGGRGFQRWPSDKALDWAVAVYDQLGGTWGHSRNAKSKIPGGRAEGKSPKDFDSKQLLMGTEVELEHTGDRELAREIAMDHLTEIPDYYTRLLRMETQAKKAMIFPTKDALKSYLEEHPAADPKNHSVKETESDKSEDTKDMDFDGSAEWEGKYSLSTPKGSIIAGTPHLSDDSEKWVKDRLIPAISSQVSAALKAGKKVTFLAEGGKFGPEGSEQRMVSDHLDKKFKGKVNQDTWDDEEVEIVKFDEKSDKDTVHTGSKIFKKLVSQFGGESDKVEAAMYAFMAGQGSDMKVTPSIKKGLKKLGLPEANSDEDIEVLYRASFPEDFSEKETYTSSVGDAYNKARQSNLKAKINRIESEGGIAVVTPGYSHVNSLSDIKTQAKKASESPTLISQRHFKAEGSDVYLFLTQYQNRNHLIRVDISGSLSFGIIASGPKSNTVFKSLGDFILNGESVYSPAYEEMNTSFHETEKLFQNVTGGKFAVKFPADDNDPEAENFMHHFKQFLREWTLNGSGNEKKFPITNHPYWPTYLASLHKALKPKILYRGIHGDFADEVSDTIPVYRFSSWTADKKIARDFARYGFVGDLASGFSTKVRRKGKFVVVASAIPVEDIVMAPVVVDALPDPEILVKTLSGQDEYVVHSHRPRLPVKIVSRSASTTPTRESALMISRIASRVFLASVADTMVNTFSFEILLRWYGAKGGLQTRKGVEPLEYTIPAAGRVKVDITGTADIESLPPKPKVIDSDEMFQNDLESFNSNVVPDDITDTLHASEFDVNDTSGEYFSLLNTRTGTVMLMHSPGLKRLTFGNKLPAKVTGTGFIVPVSVFRATYHFVPTVRVESFPEILRAMLTQVEEGVRDSDSSDRY